MTTINEECKCFQFRKISRVITQYYNKCLAPSGIKAMQFSIMVHLPENTETKLDEMSNYFGRDKGALSHNIKVLRKSGYIDVLRKEKNRGNFYKLTDKGSKVIEKAIPLWEMAQNYQYKVDNNGIIKEC
jgi:DNA-binding MarR family transcriptional regulator